MKRHLLLALLVLCLARTALAANVTVNSTTDVSDGTTSSIAALIAAPGADGVISLREAITAANNTAGSDTISFAIPGAGVRSIVPTSPLPMITDPVVIDGYTQPGASANSLAVGTNAVLLIELNGSSTSSSGLRLSGLNGGSTIRGLVINRFVGDFTDAGIRVISGNNVIAGCFIGVDPTGTTKLANGNGVRFVTGANNLLGGMTPAARNVLSGNNPSTNSAGGSSNVSIAFDGAYPPSVPVPAGTMIRGNYIGTDAAGNAAISDPSAFGATDGVLIAGGTGTIIGGADADDGALDGNVSARNIISGNLVGISTRFGTYDGDLTVQGNFIGTNASGIAAVGNYMEGINFNPYPQDGSRFTSNSLTVGGTAAGAGNVISGTIYGSGVTTNARSVVLQGNLIGTDVTGTVGLGNGGNAEAAIYLTSPFPSYPDSQVTIGGPTSAERNVISGNGTAGINSVEFRTASRLLKVQGNFIGTKGDGQSPLGNGQAGVVVNGPATIGGTATGEGNVIAYNGVDTRTGRGAGVIVPSSFSGAGPFGISIQRNSIFSNRGLGIDLGGQADTGGGNGVTLNDPMDTDSGPNNLQNFPVLTSSRTSSDGMNVVGRLNSTPNTTYRIEFFGNTELDASLYGEGRYYLGFTNVTTDANGDASFDAAVLPGSLVTATATDPNGNTSEFSQSIGQLLNVSTRLHVRTGDNVLIGGFIVRGSDPKRVIVRGLGPSLVSKGVSDALQNPTLELYDGAGHQLAFNDDWKDSQQAEIEATKIPPTDDREAAIVRSLPADDSAYTAVVRGKGDTVGTGLVEAYDLDQAANSSLANISTRGFVESGDTLLIGGFIVGNGTERVIVRALGPSLSSSGVTSPLADPTLDVRDGNGNRIGFNDNWRTNQEAEINATGIPPSNNAEAAVVAILPPGPCTAVVRSANQATGVALVEVYALD